METVYYASPLAVYKAWLWQQPDDWINALRSYDTEPFNNRRGSIPTEDISGEVVVAPEPPPPPTKNEPSLPSLWQEVSICPSICLTVLQEAGPDRTILVALLSLLGIH